MKIALIGYGSMGKAVQALAINKGHEITVIVNEAHSGLDAAGLAPTLKAADVAIDFTVAGCVRRNVEACMLAGTPLAEGTTGWLDEIDEIRGMVEQKGGAFVYGANFSVGVNLFYKVAEFAAELFSRFPEYEAFIEEQHHSRKKDAPSGTALKLKEIISRHIQGEIPVAATRAGNIPGTHRIGFDGPADQILLEHTARSREGFALGAITAAEWIVGKSGFFEFSEVLGLSPEAGG